MARSADTAEPAAVAERYVQQISEWRTRIGLYSAGGADGDQ